MPVIKEVIIKEVPKEVKFLRFSHLCIIYIQHTPLFGHVNGHAWWKFVCLSHSRMLHSYGNVTITGELRAADFYLWSALTVAFGANALTDCTTAWNTHESLNVEMCVSLCLSMADLKKNLRIFMYIRRCKLFFTLIL